MYGILQFLLLIQHSVERKQRGVRMWVCMRWSDQCQCKATATIAAIIPPNTRIKAIIAMMRLATT